MDVAYKLSRDRRLLTVNGRDYVSVRQIDSGCICKNCALSILNACMHVHDCYSIPTSVCNSHGPWQPTTGLQQKGKRNADE